MCIRPTTPRRDVRLAVVAAVALCGLAAPAAAASLDPALSAVADSISAGRPAGAGVSTGASIKTAPMPDGRQGVVVIAEPEAGRAATRLDRTKFERLGAHVDAVSRGALRLIVPADRLRNVATHPELTVLRVPLSVRPTDMGPIVGTAPGLVQASRYYDNGWDGTGAHVAVIDLGFAGWEDRVAEGELPADTEYVRFAGGPGSSPERHGAGVAEVVADVAPGARISLLEVADIVDLQNAADWCATMGVDIANHSVAWATGSYYDGTGDVSAVVDESRRQHDILWTVASGNYAEAHWRGGLRDTDGDGWLEFDLNGSEYKGLNPDPGGGSSLFLTWNQFGAPITDLDLYLYERPAGGEWTEKTRSQWTQSGLGAQIPNERISSRQLHLPSVTGVPRARLAPSRSTWCRRRRAVTAT